MRIPPLIAMLANAFRMDALIDIQWRRDGRSAWKGRTQCSDQGLVAKYMETMNKIAGATKKSPVAFVSIHLAVDLFSVFSRLFIRPVIMICYRPRKRLALGKGTLFDPAVMRQRELTEAC